MKKLLTILLSLAMILSMGSVAFADESPATLDPTSSDNNSVGFNINATVKQGDETNEFGGNAYGVVVAWEAGVIDATKSVTNSFKWNPNTYSYEKTTAIELKPTDTYYDEMHNEDGNSMIAAVKINIRNNSDNGIKYDIIYNSELNNENKLSSVYGEYGDEVGTDDEHIASTGIIDGVFGRLGLTVGQGETYADAFEKYVLNIYTDSDDQAVASNLEDKTIANVCNYLKTSWEYKDLISDLNLQNASDLFKLYLNRNITYNDYGTPICMVINSNASNNVEGFSKFTVELTEDGKEFAKTKTSSEQFKVGSFTVKVETYNYDED